jgi:peptidylprolyl isomerase
MNRIAHLDQKRRVRPGDRVRVHYTGRLPDGTVFDTSEGREPLEFTLGRGQIIPGFERAVLGREPGTFVIENVPARLAFGERRESRVLHVPLERLGRGAAPRVGQTVDLPGSGGEQARGVVLDIADGSAVVDTNHPLAGKDLTFEIHLVEVVESRPLREAPPLPSRARESMIIR